MFIGHFAVGLASKRLAPRTSLGTLLLAPLFLDALWPFFVLFGWETVRIVPGDTAFTPLEFVSYPISHSLVMALVWGALFAWIYRARTGYGRGALVTGALVVSHWVLDWVSHRADLPLFPGGGPRVGLGLWNSVPATMAVESAMFIAGLWIYLRATRARDRVGWFALWGMVALLAYLYVGNATGPPPPSVRALVIVGIVAQLFVPWGYWIDRHRVAVAVEGASG
jgi:hypothetical protein